MTDEYARLIREGNMKNIITTCCPSANELVELHHPEMAQYLAPVFSPMIAHGKMLHEQLGDNIRVVLLVLVLLRRRKQKLTVAPVVM